MIGAICSICSLEYAPGDKVIVFACHKTHMLHTQCYEELKKHTKKKKSPLTCPICRKVVVEAKNIKKELIEEDVKVEVYDPFAVKDEQAPNDSNLLSGEQMAEV